MSVQPIPLQRLPHAQDLPDPALASAGAAGFDLSAAVSAPITLAPGQRALIPSGFAISLPEGWEAQVRPRSGLALKHGVTVLNAPGTIDSDYRGEIGVILINHGDAPFTITRGDRIAQLVVARAPRIIWIETDNLTPTTRADSGFGSTGQGG